MFAMYNAGAVPPWVSLPDLQAFYFMERSLFSRLVLQMRMDPSKSMRIVALWLLLEEDGQESVILRLLSLSSRLMASVVLEAEACLAVVLPEAVTSSADGLETTASVIGDWFTFSLIEERKDTLRHGITYYVENVFPSLFADILLKAAAARERAMALLEEHDPVEALSRLSLSDVPDIMDTGIISSTEVPASETVTGGGRSFASTSTNVGHSGTDDQGTTLSSQDPVFRSSLNPSARPWFPGKRTLFLTFSKGYPLSETDIIDFFTRRFGDCIESLRLQRTPRGNQPLFATLVLKSASLVQIVLMGQERVRFKIMGKHVMARLYVARNNRASSSSGSLQTHRHSERRPQREHLGLPSRGTASTSRTTWSTNDMPSPSLLQVPASTTWSSGKPPPSSVQVPARASWSTTSPSYSSVQVPVRSSWTTGVLSSSSLQVPARASRSTSMPSSSSGQVPTIMSWSTGSPSSSLSLQFPARADRAGSSRLEANRYKVDLDRKQRDYSSLSRHRREY
ncbi:hypothetical protein H6P81_013303 [Aristolochia fimbriata]|uniref:RRM domain-containing protein n=1 Tax=Aristolochia fimbriata TaxID=158543 RepID=A0AAV7EGI6_ARIFI|nr:hypothetical protein H6P81_013303 [Aristolochia fimbriata]